MSIALLYDPQDEPLADIMAAAFMRSFSSAQVSCVDYPQIGGNHVPGHRIYCCLNPQNTHRQIVLQLAAQGCKVIILGSLGTQLATEIGIEVAPLEPDAATWGTVQPVADRTHDASAATVVYTPDHPLTTALSWQRRPLSRYDFTDEWNTLGFGRITMDGGLWSIRHHAKTTGALELAQVVDETGQWLTTYAAIADSADSAILWFNRPVGPIDSLEWTIIEAFCSHYRVADLVCIPYILEIPAGYGGAVTMRLDCDQAIATARPLFDLYQDLGVPLSLAVVTGLPPQPPDMTFLREILAGGGAVVSHSCTHPPNWGADYRAAYQEAQQSQAWLETHLSEASPVHYAVSPFHQNPPYAVRALADAGYLGFVGGIIHNDPAYLLGRSGQVPGCDRPLVSHSQQCMLHGDCYHRYGNTMTPYCESVHHHIQAGLLFGYLDHPFSDTYQYGWQSEAERLSAHATLIEYIQSYGDIWFPNLVQGLDFVRKRSLLQVTVDVHQALRVSWRSARVPLLPTPPLQISWRGETQPVSA